MLLRGVAASAPVAAAPRERRTGTHWTTTFPWIASTTACGRFDPKVVTLDRRPYTLYQPYLPPKTLHTIPFLLNPTNYGTSTLNCHPYTLNPDPKPRTRNNPGISTLHPRPCTLHLTPYISTPTPHTLHPKLMNPQL